MKTFDKYRILTNAVKLCSCERHILSKTTVSVHVSDMAFFFPLVISSQNVYKQKVTPNHLRFIWTW